MPLLVSIDQLLREGEGHNTQFSLSLQHYQIPGISFTEKSLIKGKISHIGDYLLINFDTTKFTSHEQCSRCLTDCSQTTRIREALESFSLQSPSENDYDLLVKDRDHTDINLSPLLEQELIATVRTQPLCKKNCKGLCPYCGTDLNQAACTCKEKSSDRNPFAQLKSIFPPQ